MHILAYLELSCFSADPNQNSYVTATILYMLFPVLMVAMAGLGAFLYSRIRTESSSKRTASTVAKREARSSGLAVAVIILFLLQPTFVKQFAMLFSCIKMGADGTDLFFAEDLTIRCYSLRHWTLILGLGIPLLFFFVIGRTRYNSLVVLLLCVDRFTV